MAYRQARMHLGSHGLARFRLFRSIEGLVRSALRSDVVDVLGHRMYLDAKDSAELSLNGIYEPLTTELVQREVHAGAGVLDTGANIGYYTLQFARLVGPRGRVFAFEPAPHNFALLEKNVRVNGYQNVTVVPKAVADVAGTVRLYVDEDNAGDCRIYDSRDGRRSFEVESVRLDDYFAGCQGSIDFIKMDVQGAEYAALRGMRGLLERNRDVKLVTEFWPYGLQAFGIEPEVYLRTLKDHGFSFWDVDERQGRVVPTTVPALVKRYVPEPLNATNLFCVRLDRPDLAQQKTTDFEEVSGPAAMADVLSRGASRRSNPDERAKRRDGI